MIFVYTEFRTHLAHLSKAQSVMQSASCVLIMRILDITSTSSSLAKKYFKCISHVSQDEELLQVAKRSLRVQVRLQSKMSWIVTICWVSVEKMCKRARARVREIGTERVTRTGLEWFWKAVGNWRINASYLTAVFYFYSLFTDESVMFGSEINVYTRWFNCSLFLRRAQYLTRCWINMNVRRFGILDFSILIMKVLHTIFIVYIT